MPCLALFALCSLTILPFNARLPSFNSYGLELHRLREWGLKQVKEADVLDERRLTHTQMVSMLAVLFNIKTSDLPNPQADPREFKRAVKQRLPGLAPTYDPVTDRVVPWINYASIKSCYGLPGGGCSIS